MINNPEVKIEYLVNTDIIVENSMLNDFGSTHLLTNSINLNNPNKQKGKKGFHLSGGSIDYSGEVSGCLLDGTYTFYNDQKKYNGIIGNCLSNDDYTFDIEQKIEISTVDNFTFIKSIFLYFDNVAGEYPTELIFSNEPNKIYKNNGYTFFKFFGDDSTIQSLSIKFTKWSKKNSLAKILRVRTGLTETYDAYNIQSLKWGRKKFSDANELRFGLQSYLATIKVFDFDGIVKTLYENGLDFKNISVKIYIDDQESGTYLIQDKSSNNTIQYWTFECSDILEPILSQKVKLLNVEMKKPTGGNTPVPVPRSLNYFIKYALEGIENDIVYDEGLEKELEEIMIKVPFINSGQTKYDLLLKCCQIGLIRIYIDREQKIRITRGV